MSHRFVAPNQTMVKRATSLVLIEDSGWSLRANISLMDGRSMQPVVIQHPLLHCVVSPMRITTH
jgi:hypothetical protein